MKSLSERNPIIVGAVGIALVTGAMVTALNYDKLPLINQDKHYSAYFAEAGGLIPGAAVQISGFRVGQVETISLDGARVLVKFHVQEDVRLGDRTEAAVKTKSLLGTKILEVEPRGDGEQDGAIPVERTRSAYQLPDALGDLAEAISGLNTDQLSQSLRRSPLESWPSAATKSPAWSPMPVCCWRSCGPRVPPSIRSRAASPRLPSRSRASSPTTDRLSSLRWTS
jgi:phospholipid/cholesterol/gamma-HCH transport system substrate-binding protein